MQPDVWLSGDEPVRRQRPRLSRAEVRALADRVAAAVAKRCAGLRADDFDPLWRRVIGRDLALLEVSLREAEANRPKKGASMTKALEDKCVARLTRLCEGMPGLRVADVLAALDAVDADPASGITAEETAYMRDLVTVAGALSVADVARRSAP